MALESNTKNFNGDIPYDPDDFGRCYRLLEKFPEWKEKLSIVSDLNPEWKPFVDNWEKLTKLYEEEFESGKAIKLYDEMQKLVQESRKIKAEISKNE